MAFHVFTIIYGFITIRISGSVEYEFDRILLKFNR